MNNLPDHIGKSAKHALYSYYSVFILVDGRPSIIYLI